MHRNYCYPPGSDNINNI